MHPTASAMVSLAFVLVTAGLVVSLAVGLRRYATPRAREWLLFSAWVAIPIGLAMSGVLAHWERRPPPLLPVLLLWTVGSIVFARSNTGRKLALAAPLALLVGVQAFRLPLELVMHAAASEGTMPVQMTWTGWNFDVLTGLTALPLAIWIARGRAPRAIVWTWNLLGLALLVNVVVIAIASMPMFAAFGPTRMNTWIAFAPFVWLPALEVQVALAGHLLIFRRLWATRTHAVGAAGPESSSRRHPDAAHTAGRARTS